MDVRSSYEERMKRESAGSFKFLSRLSLLLHKMRHTQWHQVVGREGFWLIVAFRFVTDDGYRPNVL